MVSQQELQSQSARFPNVSAWAIHHLDRGVAVAVVEFALSMLPFVRDLVLLCDFDLATLPASPAPRLARWHEMWKSSRAMWSDAADASDPELSQAVRNAYEFQDAGGISTELHQYFAMDAMNELASMTLHRRRAMGRLLCIQNRQARCELLNGIDEVVTGDILDRFPVPGWDVMDPFLFMGKIRVPCFAHFRFSPESLYQLAVEGDRQSLSRMLSLDPTVEQMPEVRSILIEDLPRRRPSLLGETRLKRIRTTGLDRTSCKALAICWCRQWSRLFASLNAPALQRFFSAAYGVDVRVSREFTIPGLRSLFDAYAKDCGLLIDEDLQTDGDALRKMVIRLDRSFPLRAWDIFSLNYVPMI